MEERKGLAGKGLQRFSMSMVNNFILNCRHIFNHSVKEHLYCSRNRINTLVANFLCCFLYLELGFSCAILQENENLELSLGWGHLRIVLKPLGGVTGVFVSPSFFLTLPNQFSCLSQNNLWKDQESPQNGYRD